MTERSVLRVPTVHLRGGSAMRRPLIVLAICAVGVVAYLARDFLIPGRRDCSRAHPRRRSPRSSSDCVCRRRRPQVLLRLIAGPGGRGPAGGGGAGDHELGRTGALC